MTKSDINRFLNELQESARLVNSASDSGESSSPNAMKNAANFCAFPFNFYIA